jgi:hypothetical protein
MHLSDSYENLDISFDSHSRSKITANIFLKNPFFFIFFFAWFSALHLIVSSGILNFPSLILQPQTPYDRIHVQNLRVPKQFETFLNHFWRICKIAKGDFFMSVRLCAWNNSAPDGQNFMKFHTWLFFQNLLTKNKVHLKRTRTACISHEEIYTFFITSCPLLLRMKNVSDTRCKENRNIFYVQ